MSKEIMVTKCEVDCRYLSAVNCAYCWLKANMSMKNP